MKVLTYTLTEAQYETVRAAIAQKGLELTGTQGEVKKLGADVQYEYNAPALTITVVKAPWLHNIDNFAEQLDAYIRGYIS